MVKLHIAAEQPSPHTPLPNITDNLWSPSFVIITQKVCPVWTNVKKNMVASVERSCSRCKYKVFKYKGSILEWRKQFIQFRWNTQVKTSLGLFYIQFLPIDPFHLDLTHWTFKCTCLFLFAHGACKVWIPVKFPLTLWRDACVGRGELESSTVWSSGLILSSSSPMTRWKRAPDTSGEWEGSGAAGVDSVRDDRRKMTCVTSLGPHVFITTYLLFVMGSVAQKVSEHLVQ